MTDVRERSATLLLMCRSAWALGSLFLSCAAAGCGQAPPAQPAGDAASVAVDAGPPDGAVATQAAVRALIERTCAFSSCHGGQGAGKAQLNFMRGFADGKSLSEQLNDVPSCEYPPLPLVKPFAPDQSWLMVKLSAPHDANGKIAFTPDAAFQPQLSPDVPSVCPLSEGGELSFGQLMPISGTVSRALSEQELALVRTWIEQGALPD
jgi:hypothetical protein